MAPCHPWSTALVTAGLLGLLSLMGPVRVSLAAEPSEPSEPPIEASDEPSIDPSLEPPVITDIGPDEVDQSEAEGPVLYGPARIAVHADFEAGQYAGSASRMQVRPTILTEGSNRFLRITGSAGDDDSLCTTCGTPWNAEHMNRSTLWVTSPYGSMPRLSDADPRQTYSANLRIHDQNRTGTYVSLFEFFQAGNYTGHYQPDGQGPAARFIRKNGRVYFESRYDNERKIESRDLGAIPSGSWHHYMLKAVWSHRADEGRFEVYLDGKLKHTISGRDVNLGPGSYSLPAVKFGLYGIGAVGLLDVDNIRIGPTLAGAPMPKPPATVATTPPAVTLRAPTQLRAVMP